MPAALTYPGVYIQELPSGVRTITGVATSITAFIGRAKRGKEDTAITINSFGDFERIFGGLWEESNLGFSVRDFFLNGGGQAVIVRLFAQPPISAASKKSATDAAEAVATAAKGAANFNAAKTAARNAANAFAGKWEEPFAQYVVKDVNAAADLPAAKTAVDKRVDALKKDFLDEKARAQAAAVVKAVAAAASKAADLAAAKTAAQSEADKYKDKPGEPFAAAVFGAVNSAADLDAAKKGAADAAKLLAGELKISEPAKLIIEKAGLTLEAASHGSWGAFLRARVDRQGIEDVESALGAASNTMFNLLVVDSAPGGQSESFRNLSLDPNSSRYVGTVLDAQSELVRLAEPPPKTLPKPQHPDEDFGDTVTEAGYNWQKAKADATKTALAGDGYVKQDAQGPLDELRKKISEAEKAMLGDAADGGGLRGLQFLPDRGEQEKKGLFALEQIDLFNLLCIPPYKPGSDTAGDVDTLLVQTAAAYCERRRAMLVVDSPSEWDNKEEAKKGFTQPGDTRFPGIASKNAAIFFPRLRQANPLHDFRIETFAPSGAVAGIMARTDVQRGVWKAPAGFEATIAGSQGLSVNLTDAENGELNPLGMNCLRAFPVAGTLVWGARTLRGADQLADEWKYIPVRRTALFIEESLYRGTKWVVFEPNDEPLWAQIRLNVGAFMNDLFRQGAFQGQKPSDAYFVKCDGNTTKQNDINKGIVNILVGFAPLKPAEFVVISLQQIAGQIQT